MDAQTLDQIFKTYALGKVTLQSSRTSNKDSWFLPMYKHGDRYIGHTDKGTAHSRLSDDGVLWNIFAPPKPRVRLFQYVVKYKGLNTFPFTTDEWFRSQTEFEQEYAKALGSMEWFEILPSKEFPG